MQLLPPTPDHSQVSSLTIHANSGLSQQVSLVRGGGGQRQGRGRPQEPAEGRTAQKVPV